MKEKGRGCWVLEKNYIYKDLKKDFNALKKDFKAVKKDFNTLKKDFKAIKKVLKALKKHFKALRALDLLLQLFNYHKNIKVNEDVKGHNLSSNILSLWLTNNLTTYA